MKRVISLVLALVTLGGCGVSLADAEASYWLPIRDVTATAAFSNWPVRNVLDYSDENCWQYNKDKTEDGGYGASVVLYLEKASRVEWLNVKNGFWKVGEHDQYWRNNRVKDAIVSFQYYGQRSFSDAMVYTFVDRKEAVNIDLGARDNVVAVKLQIVSVYRGNGFDDVALTYLGIYGCEHQYGPPPPGPGPIIPPYEGWTRIPAVLNQKMATRSGPGTKYTEEHTYPIDTEVMVLRMERNGSSVNWVYVEFRTDGALKRVYTGRKRVDTDWEIPWGPEAPMRYARIGENCPRGRHGPGDNYQPLRSDRRMAAAGERVEVWGYENGWVFIEYPYEGPKFIRLWVPEWALVYE